MKFLRLCFILLVPFSFSETGAQNDVKYEMVVAQDGSGDFTTIQAAIEATKAFPDSRIAILIKNGIYREKVRVPSWNPLLSVIGESTENTRIVWDDYFNTINRGRNSTFYTATFLVEANDFYAENLTIENNAGPVGQAVALHIEGDRCRFKNCRIIGNQDTFYGAGETSRIFFQNCYMEGTTDFIFGEATVLFQNCIIQCKSDSYITAASTNKDKTFGFVFLNCKLTAAEGVQKVYLGRPWRKYAKTVFIHCEMANHILQEGWHGWNADPKEETVFYAEFENTGVGSEIKNRVEWSHQLTKKEAKKYKPLKIMGDWILPFVSE